ncbi:DUF692 family protein [Pseudoduganella sp. DS3]|uniref:DUF692 family protein n=1 Tax=Pseudoduganella guangdongensis TaxID=2692179 RepID=A0A6N9HIA6_9BURK|nr:DUF692 family multinuclear iron-containing protein [Pseudoduganella guangdongensis]MYN03351.1 DUF692 family protein [Pseudoduganella guangdongensis]
MKSSNARLADAVPRPAPGVGVSYEGREPALLELMLPHVDIIEVTPETMSLADGDSIRLDPAIVAELRNIDREKTIVVHGVSLSIGSHDGWSPTYLRLLDELMDKVRVRWHSEHLGYTRVDGEHLGIMLALPRTEQAAELVAQRAWCLQQRYGLPFLLENIVHVVPDCPADYTDAGFLNAIAADSGCGLILDVYNLECDAHNHALDIPAFLAELDGEHVRELHVACGVRHNGLMLDVHSRLPRSCTLDLAQQVLRDVAPGAEVIVYEFMPEAVPGLGHAAIADTLQQMRQRQWR